MATTFEEYLPRLLDPASPLAAGDLAALSALTATNIQILSQSWSRIPLEKRRKMLHYMVDLAEDNVELDYNDVFKLALNDPDVEVREQAAGGLTEDEELTTADALVRVLRHDPAPEVRAAAAISLGHFVYGIELEDLDEQTGARIKEALYATIDNPAEPIEVRRRAIEAAGYLSEDHIRRAIAQAYATESTKMRASALFAMGRNAHPRWVPMVIQEFQDDDPEIRFEAARAAAELEDKRAIPGLLRLLVDPDREVRVAAIMALGELGGPEAKRALQHIAAGDDEEFAEAAKEALEELSFFEDPLRFRSTGGDDD